MSENSLQQRITRLLRELAQHDLRASYIIIAAMIPIAAVLNLTLSHGWTVWPFVGAVGILTYINEAADRNGQGLPPFQVYAFFFGAVIVWLVLVIVLSAMNPLIILLGIAFIVYRGGQAYLIQRQRDQLIAKRRLEGLCIHCGEPYDPNVAFCENCGEEPNPDAQLLTRVAEVYHSPQQMARARAMLSKQRTSSSASSKEAALMARRRTGKVKAASELPKAAKLGGSTKSSRGK